MRDLNHQYFVRELISQASSAEDPHRVKMLDEIPAQLVHDALHDQLDDLVEAERAELEGAQQPREPQRVDPVRVEDQLRAAREQRQLVLLLGH